ncbi:STT3 domain-containing protein [Methanobrevibacter oralis]|uniref:dolichyl-phosphooligosaccharide-protein glycotransferase n=1 Tax=Methanobrevibacter oralis TaxID=66851 RepID=A0A166BXZ5_METOA|nr:STT3 domain-containing protein [Methanobrevibacter oralis]KZX13932.1 oligosaccharyl transferase STT3 subunit [Methanobrevibacter oralis]
MNRQTLMTITKGVIIVLILLAVVFALRTPAADLNVIPNEIKGDYHDASGLPYFSEMDSYYNLRLTEDYIDHGYVGDKIVDGKEVDMHRYAPDGNNISYELGIVYVTSFFYDMANQYLGDYSVREIAFWTGAIIASLAVIPAFIFSRRLTNDYGAIVATLIIVLAPNYFAHTFPGFFDTDMFYYIFSLLFIFFFVESIRAKNIILKVIFALISIISIGLFSISWTGYIFYVGLMGIFSIVYLIACYFFNIGDDDVQEYSNKFQWFIHQKDLVSIILIGVIGFIGLALFQGVGGVTGIFGRVMGLLSLQSASTVVGGFPNVLISVAEMQMPAMLGEGMISAFLANTNGVVNGIGGITILFTGLIVLYLLISRAFKLRNVKVKSDDLTYKKPHKSKRLSSAKKLDDKRKFKLSLNDLNDFGSVDEMINTKRLTVLYASLFLVWTLITILAVSRGSRFITTLVLPFALMTGIFVGYATDYIKNKLDSDKWLMFLVFLTGFLTAIPLTQINNTYGILLFLVIVVVGAIAIYAIKSNSASTKVPFKKYVVVVALVLALVSPSICGAYITSENVIPGTSDPMWNSMEWINEHTSNDTVITSWWDFGYLFEIAADRQVTFDGGSQTGSRAFWLGQAMTTDNLELSAGIFRMLDTSGERAVDALINYTGDTGKTTKILIDILPMTKQNAQKTLIDKYDLSTDQAKEIVGYTHPSKPRPVIFVASSDMLQKAGWWSYFGAWDFKNQSSENYNYYVPTEQVKVESGSSGKLSLIVDGGMTVNAVITRGTGNNTTSAYTEAVYTHNGSQIYVNKTVYNPLNISNLIVVEDGYLMKNESVGNVKDANYTLFLMGEKNKYTPILISNKLANSMFTKLYLLGGAGQDIFTNVHTEEGVMLWQVNFNNTVAGK